MCILPSGPILQGRRFCTVAPALQPSGPRWRYGRHAAAADCLGVDQVNGVAACIQKGSTIVTIMVLIDNRFPQNLLKQWCNRMFPKEADSAAVSQRTSAEQGSGDVAWRQSQQV